MANEISIEINADPAKAQAGLKTLKGSLDDFAKRARGAGIALGAMGAAGIFAAGKLVQSSQEQQIGINRLDQSLKNVGQSYAGNKDAIEAVIEATQRKTNFGDEQQRDALQKLVTIGGQWQGSLEALKVTTDLAAGAGMDLNAAALLLGKAIAGETGSLSRYGIVLEKGATQTEIMAALTAQFGGAAEAAADPITQMKNRLGDLGQVVGDAILPFVEKLVVKLEILTRFIIDWTSAHPQLTKVIALTGVALAAVAVAVGGLVVAMPVLIGMVGAFGVAFNLALGPIGLVALAIAGLVAVFSTNLFGIRDIVKTAIGWITGHFTDLVMFLLPGGAILTLWRNNLFGFSDAVSFVAEAIGDGLEVIVNGFIDMVNAIIRVWNKLPWTDDIGEIGKVELAWGQALDKIRATVDEKLDGLNVSIRNGIGTAFGALTGAVGMGGGGGASASAIATMTGTGEVGPGGGVMPGMPSVSAVTGAVIGGGGVPAADIPINQFFQSIRNLSKKTAMEYNQAFEVMSNDTRTLTKQIDKLSVATKGFGGNFSDTWTRIEEEALASLKAIQQVENAIDRMSGGLPDIGGMRAGDPFMRMKETALYPNLFDPQGGRVSFTPPGMEGGVQNIFQLIRALELSGVAEVDKEKWALMLGAVGSKEYIKAMEGDSSQVWLDNQMVTGP
jgi:hypothetical protein